MRQHRLLAVMSATESCFLPSAARLMPVTPPGNFSLFAKHPEQRIPIAEFYTIKAALDGRAETLRRAGYIVTIQSPMLQ